MVKRDCVRFGASLRALRKERTLRDVAKSTNYDFTWLSKLENGRELPSWEALKRILAFYGEKDLNKWAYDLLKITKSEQFDLALDHAQ